MDSSNSDLWIVGLGVFFFSQILINLGQNVVRLSHTKKSRFLWWMGLSFFLVGNLGSFSALNLAPQSTLEGLGAIQFLSNLIFAYRVLGEQILVRHAVSTSLIVAGNVLLVTFGQPLFFIQDLKIQKNICRIPHQPGGERRGNCAPCHATFLHYLCHCNVQSGFPVAVQRFFHNGPAPRKVPFLHRVQRESICPPCCVCHYFRDDWRKFCASGKVLHQFNWAEHGAWRGQPAPDANTGPTG